jgi:hypothetical protein
MGERWRTADGQWCVDAIRLSATPDRRDGEWLRVRWLGYWKADVRTVAELARLVPLDWLQEALLLVRAARFRQEVNARNQCTSDSVAGLRRFRGSHALELRGWGADDRLGR